MTSAEQKTILTIALYAAFADGAKDDREREEIRRIAESLANETATPDLARLYQDVLLKRIDLAAAAAGMAFSFATTYALGQLAKRYYAGGRAMNTALLRDTFESLLAPARQMQTQYLPQIRQQAATLDMGRVMAMVRGS